MAAAQHIVPRQANARWLLLLLPVTLLLAGIGLWIGMSLATPGQYHTRLGNVSMQIRLDTNHSGLDAYIPLADWGIRASVVDAPVMLHMEPRTLNRSALITAAQGNKQMLHQAQQQLRDAAQAAVLRSLAYAYGGVLVSAFLAWLLLWACHVRQRGWLLAAPLLVIMWATLFLSGMIVWSQLSYNSKALEQPSFYARGDELPQLLSAAQGAKKAGDDYSAKVLGSVQGFSQLLTNPSQGLLTSKDHSALLMSDLHNNQFALSGLHQFRSKEPVFFVGDFGNTGSIEEANAFAKNIARLSPTTITVGGNHDSTLMMQRLEDAGAWVLDRHGAHYRGKTFRQPVNINGYLVAGWDDPLMDHSNLPDRPERIFSFGQLNNGEQRQDKAEQQLRQWFLSLSRRPRIVLVHQVQLAQSLAQYLQDTKYAYPLTILTGHDHHQHIDTYGGRIAVVDAGSVGAGGVYGVGHDQVGFAKLHFSGKDILEAVDMIHIEPVSGAAQAQRLPLADCYLTPKICQQQALDTTPANK